MVFTSTLRETTPRHLTFEKLVDAQSDAPRNQRVCLGSSNMSTYLSLTIEYLGPCVGVGHRLRRWDAIYSGITATDAQTHILTDPPPPPLPPLTIARDQRSVVSALLRGGLARRRLREEVVFAQSALPSCGGIQ